jgi:hypothetical protein
VDDMVGVPAATMEAKSLDNKTNKEKLPEFLMTISAPYQS